MRIKYLFLFYAKNIVKSKLYLTASIGFILLTTFQIYNYFNTWPDARDYADLPGEIFVVIELFALLYMIYFYLTFSNELNYGIHRYFTDSYKILLEKLTALFSIHFLIQFIVLLLTYSIFVMTYYWGGVEWSPIYGSLFRLLVDYMFAPLLFASLIGLVIASIFGDKKISVIVIVLIWFFTGGLNQELFTTFFREVGTKDWESLLSIGPYSIFTLYSPYIGFDVYEGLEWRLLTWLSILLFLLSFASIKWAVIKKERRIMTFIVAVLLCFSIFSGRMSMITNTSAFNNADFNKEVLTYRQLQSVTTDLNYEVEAYVIQMEKDKVHAKLSFLHANTDNPSFQLYYAFPIEKIMVDGQEVSYSREGDIVKIVSPTDNFNEIEFIYEITHTQLVPYTNNRLVLLANQAWYPKKREKHMYEKDGSDYIKLTDNTSNVNETYDFHLEAEDVLFTNLEGSNDNYQGSSSGLSIIIGQGHQLEYKGYEVTYPSDWTDMREQTKKIIERLEINFDELGRIVPLKVSEPPSKIVLNGPYSFIREDHLVYDARGYSVAMTHPDAFSTFGLNLIPILVEPKDPIVMFNEWVNLTSFMIKREYNYSIIFQTPTVEVLGTSLEERVYDIHAAFGGWDIEDKRSFLKQWYLEMDDRWTWEDVEQLVEERKVQ